MEIWKDVKGYEGLYQVSNHGRVKSLNYNHTKKEKVLVPLKHQNGYLFVNINGKQQSIHRLIAKTFIPNQKNKNQVNHIDGNKENNRIDNLEWCTAKENTRHAYKNGLINLNTEKKKKSELININKATEKNKKRIIQCDLCGNVINTFDSIVDASRSTKSNATHISLCAKGKQNTCNGYIWRYVNE